jgi:hypothetical protein
MSKGGKWVDCQKTLVGIGGVLSRLPVPQARKEDGLFSAFLVPDDKNVLLNRNGVRNKNDMLELRFRLDESRSDVFWNTFQTIVNHRVQVTGALVNDDAKEGKAEIHPLDAIWSQLPESMFPEWAQGLKKNMRDPNAGMQVFRVMAVSDASKSGAPAPASENRSVRIPFSYPLPAPSSGNPELKYEIKPSCVHNTDFQLNHEHIRQQLELVVELKAVKNDGPTVFVADLAIFWN